ncbi:peptidoglycan DD-metalloendopeptidase family protein [Staphylococcus succinus]|uniref:peptidoglycan DD-metalloendopeptidase family protein n=1 Tax=Staphylococcus succinus TaxID=61015 RepID=UPI00069E222A|nr:peptidoglycan DD-metalloendopeptidase family protein [Staphylococcus succinus]MDH9162065.1 peptidoglycan DD-metalloendopeptidase family protein [Staphylococcus succinus]PNZ17383.1 phage tail tape measure protein [Staphylococcus succinus subsp. succinus]RIN43269.1 phage tail tape measure protein [Staphylococcus succinus]
MADFNLGAEVSMDVDPLKASKTTLERNLKAINKSLRDQRKEFKQNELSAEGLAKQEADLGRAIKLQEGLLKKRKSTLNDLERQMKESNNVTDEQKIKLQNASRAVQQAENQLSGYNNELKQTQSSQKMLGRSTDQVKSSLGQLRNEAKLTEMRFKQSGKTVEGYKGHLDQLNYTMKKQKAHMDLLKGNLKELERAQQGGSRSATKLRNDIAKEAIAFQILQGRIDETTDELREYQRQQRLMGTMTNAWEGARNSMDRIATTLRSLGELTQGVVGGVMVTNFSALVPIMGSVISLGAGIGGMLVALTGGAVGMGGAFAIAGVGVQAFGGQAVYALKMLEDGQLKVTNEVKSYQTALSGLKTSWEGLIKQNQASIFNTMTNGINTAKHALTTLNPFLTQTAKQIETASGQMLNWARTSSNAKRAFDILNTQGPKIFQSLINATRSFVNGSTAMFNKLSPLYTWAAQGFANMGKSFDNWANSVQGSKAINGFVEYTKTNLPIVGDIFGNIFSGIINLFQSFSGHSHNVLLGIQSATKGFADWSEGIKKSDGFQKFVDYLEVNGPKVWSLIKSITQTLWGLAKGMAPVGSAVLSISGAFFKWTATMTNAHPMIGKILGLVTAFGGATLLAAKPILLLRGALLGATGASKLFGKAGAIAIIKTKLLGKEGLIASTRMKIASAATKAWSVTTKLAALATRGLGLAIRFMTGPVGIVITAIGLFVAAIIHLWKTNATFRKNVIGAWNAIKKGAVAIFGAIKKAVISIWHGLVNGVMFIVKNWKKILIARFYLMKAVVISVFRVMKASVVKIWTTLKNGVIRLAKLLYTGVTNYFKLVKKVNTTIFNAIKNFALKVWTTIKNGVVSRAKALWSGVRKMFSSLSKSTHSIFNSIKNFALKLWSNLKNNVVSRAKALWSGVKNVWNTLKKGTSIIFGSVGKFMSNKWNSIKSGTVNKVKSLWSGMKNVWGSLSKGTRSIMNSIGGFFSKKWNGIKKSTIGIVTSLKSKVTGVMSKMGDGIKNVVGKIKGFFTDMIDKVKGGLNKLIKGVNWVGKKLGMDKIDPVNFHTGTTHTTTNLVKNGKIAKDTMATVGDKGKGNGPGGFRHETIIPPKGKPFITPARDTTIPISKGTAILNGAQTHAMLSDGGNEFSTGTIPRFASGSLSNKKPKKHKKGDNVFGDAWDSTKAGAAKLVDGGKAIVSKTLETAVKGKDWLKDKIGDVMDWIEKPGKLMNKVLEGFGVNMEGFGIGKAASLPYDMMSGMFGKLKKATTDLFTKWFDEQGGSGDGGYIDLSKGINFGFANSAAEAAKAGYPFPRAHHGLDINYGYGSKLYSTLAGTATAKSGYNGGFGNSMWIKSGAMEAIYGHMSKLAFSGSKKVKPGTYLGLSGGDPSKQGASAGDSTGPHLHYEMRKNGVAFDPTNWLKKNNGGGKKSGKKWASTIKKALAMNGLPTSAAYVNAWARQIDSESGGNPKAVQGGYVDANTGGNEAKGLVQVAKGTFNQYKRKGHGNVFNPLDNLLAGIAYAKSRYGKSGMLGVIGHGHGYAKGTNSATAGMAQVFEKGGEIMQMRGGETVIPNDVSIQAFKQIATSDIFSKTQSAVYDGISRYADQLREKQQQATKEQLELQRLSRENNDVQEQNNILKEILYNMQALVQSSRNNEQYNAQTANKNWNLDGKGITKAVNKQQGSDMISALYNNGGALT